MAFTTADRVKETATTTGTGNFALLGGVTGYQAFSVVCANNDYVWYCIAHQTLGEWEVGLGQWQTGNTLVRTDANVLSGSAGAGARVNFSAGTKDVFITAPASRMAIVDDELAINIPQVAAIPSAAPTGYLQIYARSRAGRVLPEFIGPSGIDSAVQPALFGNNVTMWLPGTGSTASINFGVNWTISTTQSHPTIADTSIMTAIKRATFTTTTTAGNQTGIRTAAPIAIRNRGFFFFARFGILTYTATMQIWVGLSGVSGALAGDPSAQNDTICMSKDTGETTWQVLTRDTSAASKTTTGRTTAASANINLFDFTAFCKPADSKITVRVVDMGDGTVLINNVDKSSNLPTNATVLYAHAECRNSAGGAGSAVAIWLNRIYVETDN